MITVRNIAIDLNVTEATIRKKIKTMGLPKDTSGRLIITTEDYLKFLYKFYPKQYAIVSRKSVVVHQKGLDNHMLSKGKINKVRDKYYLRQFPIGYDENGQVIYKNSTGLPTRKDCEDLREQWLAEREQQAKPKGKTYVSFYDYCLKMYTENTKLSQSTHITMENAIEKHLKGYFKNIAIQDLTVSLVNKFIDTRLTTNVRHVRHIILKGLTKLYKEGVLKVNIGTLVEFPKAPKKKSKKPLSKAQLNQLFDYYEGHRLEHAIHLIFKSGIRCGELLALTWDDIELLEDNLIVLNIRKSMGLTEVGRGVKEPKNSYSIRKVYIFDEYLWKLLVTCRDNKKTKWVVPNKRHTAPVQYVTFASVYFRDVGKRLGFPNTLTPHVARHTYISMCLNNGITPEYIAPQVGHCDTTMIYTVYGKATEDIKETYRNFRM